MYLALSRSSLLLGSVLLMQALTTALASAQSIAPAADGTGTTVTPRGNTININGGQLSRDRANLFHSFQKFGLNSGEIANFLSNPAIKNILGRVTGGDASIINGLIQVSGGNSNLFLMNPAGIVFGSSASLNVPASFTATTANAIGFGNNNWFNALGGNNYATLVGNPNSFAFTKENIGAIANSGNIAVNPGQSISLVGGSVINTGTLSAPGGNITITAVPEQKLVRITPAGSLLSLELPLDTKTTINANTQKTIAPTSLPQLLTGGTIPDALQVVTSPDGKVQVVGNNGYVGNKGEIAASSSNNGGQVNINSRVLENRGSISASGNTGGNINIQTSNLLDAGQIAALGTGGNGGNIAVNYSGTVIQTASATTEANGQGGGSITFNGGQDTILTTSGSLQATGETGGKIRIFGGDLRLMAASLNASGSGGGGEILAGGDYQGKTTGAINAQKTFVNHATTLNADALENGNGGKVIVWSDQRTDFYGTVTARGGKDSGNGGFMEVSGKNDLAFNGMADASAAQGKAGQLLLDPKNIVIDSSVNSGAIQLLDPNPNNSQNPNNLQNAFGLKTAVLSNGNIVVSSYGDDLIAKDAGAVYLFNPTTGALLGTINGQNTNDNFGNGAIAGLTNGNFVFGNLYADAGGYDRGTVILANGTSGVEINRFNGQDDVDYFGAGGIAGLTNGNFVFGNPYASYASAGGVRRGTVILANGTTGVEINRINGQANGDYFGYGAIVGLTNGNFVFGNPLASAGGRQRGTVILANGTNGVEINRINGQADNDRFGSNAIAGLTNGNFVFGNPNASAGGTNRGTVIVANGTTGVEINRINGQADNNYFGNGPIVALTNGNFVFGNTNFASHKGGVNIAIANPSSLTYGYFASQDITINPALITRITNTGTAVTLQANNDITVNSPVISNNPTGNGGDLTLQAGRSILVNADITTDNGNLTLIANDTAAAGVVNALRDPGNAVITVAPGVTFNSGTGNITIRLSTGAGLTNSMSGDITLGNINAGNLLVENNGVNSGSVIVSRSVNANNINLTGNEIDLKGGANSVRGSTIQLQPTTAQQNIQIGNLADSGAATLDLTTRDLAALKAGFSQVNIGRADDSGTVTLNDAAVFNSQGNIAGGSTLVGSNNNTTWNVTGSNKGNLSSANHSLTFENVGNLVGGSGNDSFKFTDTTASISGNIDGKEGTNSLDYSAYSGDASVTLGTTTSGKATGVGGTILNIQGVSGNSAYNNTLTGENVANNWSITGANSGTINGNVTFENFQNLTGGSDNDSFKFTESTASISSNIDGKEGTNSLDYSAYSGDVSVTLGTNTPGKATAVGGSILNIQGVSGNSGYNNTLTGENAANNWSITGTNSGNINGNVTFDNFQNLTGGSDNDKFTLNGGSVAKISGGAGTNTVVADNTNNTWNITGSNEGNINGVVAFSNIQNLEGGSANDIFKVSHRGTISGTVDGNLGYDTIDYSASTNPFSVDLQLLLRLRQVELLVWKMPLFQLYRINRIQLSPQQGDITSGARPANTPLQQPDATSGARAPNTPIQQLDATPQLQYPSFQYETSPKPQKQPQQVSEKVVLAIASTVDVRLDKLNKLLIAIANFMNSNGGSLSISVDDLLASGDKHGIGFSNNQDLIRQNILTRVSASIGAEFTSLVKVRFANVGGKKMAIVEVSKAPKPALIKRD